MANQQGSSPLSSISNEEAPNHFVDENDENERPLFDYPEHEQQQPKKHKKKGSNKRPPGPVDHSNTPAKRQSIVSGDASQVPQEPLEEAEPTLTAEEVEEQFEEFWENVDTTLRNEEQNILVDIHTTVQKIGSSLTTHETSNGKLEEVLDAIKENTTSNKKITEALNRNIAVGEKLYKHLKAKPLHTEQLSQIEETINKIQTKVNAQEEKMTTVVKTVTKIDSRDASGINTTIRHAQQFENQVNSLEFPKSSVVHCVLCNMHNHNTISCLKYKSPADKLKRANQLELCLTCLELNTPEHHTTCKFRHVQCKKCAGLGQKGSSIQHRGMFCLLSLNDSTKQHRSSDGKGPRPPAMGRHQASRPQFH